MRTTAGRVALLLVICLVLGNPGCGCGTDTGLLTACSCVGSFEFLTPPPAPLPPGVTLVNLVRDPGNGSIGFGPTISTFPSVYMAASYRGTIVRIDVNTGVILGEYRTSPQSNPGLSPSRTTVDKFGECWVGNRQDIFDLNTTQRGSVTRIGIATGGTRYARSGPIGGPYTYSASATGEFLQGPFSYLSPSVVDRDGDGYIRTSYGLPNTSILDWDAGVTGGNSGGGVTLADDELIVNFTRVACSGTRGLAIDCDNDLWVGGTGNTNWQEVNGATGAAGIIRTFSTAYGGAIDANEVLWSVASPFAQHDIAANTTSSSPNPGLYGIAIDPCTTNIWTSGNALRHWGPSPSAPILGTFPWPGNFGHGLCVDLNGDIWAAMGNAGVFHYNSAGVFQPPAITAGLNYAKGTAVDQNGHIWVADLGGDQAVRINTSGVPTIDIVVPMGAGAGPYNYSDMTGLAALSSCGETGYLIATHDALCAGTDWGRVTVQTLGTSLTAGGGMTVAGCTITSEVRASDDPLNFPTTWTPVGNGQSFCGAPPISGQYIQIRVTFNRPPGCPPACDPRLTSLTIECCDEADGPPNVALDGPFNAPDPNVNGSDLVAPLALATVPVTVSGIVTDPDGDPVTARWSLDGADQGPAVLDQTGHTSFTRDYLVGVFVVALTASDGRNTTTAKTTITVGDHTPPVITCAPSTNGQIIVRAFQAQIPNLAVQTTATDNDGALPFITQLPPAGSPVPQGDYPIVVTAMDQAGNTATCTVIFRVAGVAEIASPVRYQFFAPMTPILVSATYFQPGVIQTTVFVDGVNFTTVGGEIVMPINIGPLPVGVHTVQLEVFNVIFSRSEEVLFDVR